VDRATAILQHSPDFVEELRKVTEWKEVPAAQIAIAWVLSRREDKGC
jgi:aryl-alcohol dehydrogenase-like predicted oxidoreductase